MTEVHIKNFQSIKDLQFKIEGFTVLIGKNNIGKSAIIRAISAALNNEAEKNYLRLGEKYMEVKITRPDIDFTWTKGDSASYKVTPKNLPTETFTKLNRAVPDLLIKAGFDKISIDDEMMSPLIAEQFSPLFLLDKRGSVITEVLTALYDMDTLNIADEKCQKDLKNNKSLLKTRESDLKILQTKLEKYKDFEKIKLDVARLVDEETKSIELQKEITLLSSYEKDLNEILLNLDNLKRIMAVTIPDLTIIENLIPDYQWLIKTEQDFITISAAAKALRGITKIKVPDIQDIASSLPELEWITTKEQEILNVSKAVETFKPIQEIKIPKIDFIENHTIEVKTLIEWDETVVDLKFKIEKQKEIRNLNLIPVQEKIQQIEKAIRDYSEVVEQEQSFMDQLSSTRALREDLKNISAEYTTKNNELLTFNFCPLCEKPLHD